MQHQEKKFRVDSLTHVQAKLEELGAQASSTATSTHFYAPQTGNNVVKLVVGVDKSEIHVLEESNATFSLKQVIPMRDKGDGLRWLKAQGYEQVGVVAMSHEDYTYNKGVIGLYIINDFLYSVILDFPSSQHEVIQRQLGLRDAEQIEVPYNKYLDQLWRLEVISLA